MTVGLCGDLKFGRTVHSLIAAMSRYTGIKFVLISPEELKVPRYVKAVSSTHLVHNVIQIERYESRRRKGMSTDNISRIVAKDLRAIKAVFFRPDEPFTWASGIKSPVYCDNRLTLTSPAVRNDVENALAETIKREYPHAEVLMGTSTAGIAHAAITAHILDMPMGYVDVYKRQV